MAIYFEWDEDKAASNLRAHGIRFETARLVFDDPYRLTEEDSVVVGEQRWRTIGVADGMAILLVVHLEEVVDNRLFVRIISARKSTSLRGENMSRIVRMSSEEPISAETLEELKRIAEMPDSEIRTDLIPERHFNLALAAERRKAGWKPGVVVQKKAS